MTGAAAAVVAFNLICSGTLSIGHMSGIGFDSEMAFSETYRIDLARKRWCYRTCTETEPIVEVTPERIVFEHEERGQMDDTFSFANRENGVFSSRTRGGIPNGILIVQRGHCERSPFTGFPARKF